MSLIMNSRLSNKFRNLGFVAAWMMVFIHVGGPAARDGAAWWFAEIVKYGFSVVAVPFFFVTSGYWLARNYQYADAVRKRVRSILVPYLLWSAIFLAFSKTLQVAANLRAHRTLMENVFVADQIWTWFGLDLTVQPYCVPFWYLRTLFLLTLVSPVIVFAAKRLPRFWLASLFASMFVGAPELFCLQWAAVFYFSVGVALQLKCPEFSIPKGLAVGAGIFGVVLAAVTAYGHYTGGAFAAYSHRLMIPCMMIAAFAAISDGAWPKWITSSSFAIYIVHTFYLCLIGITFPSWTESIPGLIARWFIAAAGSMIFAGFAQKTRKLGTGVK